MVYLSLTLDKGEIKERHHWVECGTFPAALVPSYLAPSGKEIALAPQGQSGGEEPSSSIY